MRSGESWRKPRSQSSPELPQKRPPGKPLRTWRRSSRLRRGTRLADPWWRSAVVYQVYPRSFCDADARGEGNLPGVRSRLPYLMDLGVDAIWLNPFYPSPMHDGGYDVADYCDVDPRFGTLRDFDALVADAMALGIRVIIDIVPNHCSSRHPWFEEALSSGPGSNARERFIFRDTPNNWQSHFDGPAWTRTPDGQYYLHLFDSTQPDFNWRHPDVVAMFERVLRFWLDRGVAAVRVDMANTLFKDSELPDRLADSRLVPYYNRPELHDLYRSWRGILDSYPADVYPGPRGAIAEIWFDDPDSARPYLADGGLPQTFNFRLMLVPWAAAELRAVIDEARQLVADSGGSMPWVLGNHDITRMVSRLGIDQALIRHPTEALRRGTVEPDKVLGTRRARAAALLILALPGTAYLYQGDELGLPEHLAIPVERRDDPTFHRTGGAAVGRDGCRVPLPWSGDAPPYGFANRPVRTWLPQPLDWAALTVATELSEVDSVLNLYRSALRLRRQHPALGDGEMRWLDAGADTLAFTREPGFGFVANFGDRPVMMPAGSHVILASGPLYGALLPADTAVWLKFQ
ncbi:glycoside hydrolase family 13 protein [Streptomyces lunaelactis]|nr:glycoside hydrolase family 13 protein [Streptomyces lunaelactis]NUK25111.1 glycoside hydrolase family 13 protein [Streptomyces lunaelactis]NUK36737.1 glycoside hydrolase family 13 protein [Streptomyces lunaelactis]NUK43269.1 glycoside hydrolase family 13 protein [Streptomyces lunaelactis]NUK52879.1 glycoside hydrolase family 13 protein [Streptomyces lunaelactis]